MAELKSPVDVRALRGQVPAVRALALPDPDAVAEALSARGGIAELRRLSLSICDQLTDEDVAALATHGALTHLNLSMCPALSEEVLAAIIKRHPLEERTIGGTGLRRLEFEMKAARALARKRSLRGLHLSACQPGSRTQTAIASLRGLESLRLVQMKLDADAFSRPTPCAGKPRNSWRRPSRSCRPPSARSSV